MDFEEMCLFPYYLCAFARDPKQREEFKMYIDIDQDICNGAAEQRALEDNQVSDDEFSHKARMRQNI